MQGFRRLSGGTGHRYALQLYLAFGPIYTCFIHGISYKSKKLCDF